MSDPSSTWKYRITVPHGVPNAAPDVVTERIQAALVGAGYTNGGDAPDVALVSMDGSQITALVNSDTDPTAFLQQLATIPQTTKEQDTSNLKAQLVQYRDAVKAGTTVTATQTARALAALITVLQQENQA
jgi:hypothetical protein